MPSWKWASPCRARGPPPSCSPWPAGRPAQVPARFHRRRRRANRKSEKDPLSDMNTEPETRRPSMVRAAITGVHGSLPDYVLTNAELAALVDTTDSWIVERTGIRERRILKGPGLGTSHMASGAVKGLLEKTGTVAADVDLLICATTRPPVPASSTR